MLRALADPEKITVVQVAPAVRVAWAEFMEIPTKLATTGRMVAALKTMGFDYVFDTNFTADLTIMEEGRVSGAVYPSRQIPLAYVPPPAVQAGCGS